MFCCKGCAIYGNIGLTGQDQLALLDQVYEEWFPHRVRDKDFADDTFFGKFMRFVPAVPKIEDSVGIRGHMGHLVYGVEAGLESI